MVPLVALWLPILLSAVLVFVLSTLIHTVLGYHANDFSRLPAEDRVMEALREAGVPPGEYAMPHASSMKEMNDPAYVEKAKRGPVALLTVAPSGPPTMGKSLAIWFVFSLVVGIFAAYVTGRALPPGAEYKAVFRFVGTVAFIGYALALWQNTIWYHRKWSTTLKNTFDGAVYALASAGVFGWLWPG
jgi:hypothetical protein